MVSLESHRGDTLHGRSEVRRVGRSRKLPALGRSSPTPLRDGVSGCRFGPRALPSARRAEIDLASALPGLYGRGDAAFLEIQIVLLNPGTTIMSGARMLTPGAPQIYFKRMTSAMPNYGWYLTQLSTFVYVPIFAVLSGTGAMQHAKPGLLFKFAMMGVFDGLSGTLMVLGGVHTSGTMQVLLSQASMALSEGLIGIGDAQFELGGMLAQEPDWGFCELRSTLGSEIGVRQGCRGMIRQGGSP